METQASHSDTDLRNLLRELLIAIATLSRWSLFARLGIGDAERRARALIFMPALGLLAGIALAAIDLMLGEFISLIARSLTVILLLEMVTGAMDVLGIADSADAIRIGSRPASTGIARIGPFGAFAAIVWFISAVYLLTQIHDPTGRSAALVMMMTLSRWAIVPIGYGLRPLERWGLGVPYENGIRFREFAVSSVVALGVTLGLYENVGLAVIVALALTILALRLVFSRRLGGAAGYALAGGMAVCDLVIFAVLVALKI
jgi:adenosylcobinamide-GDP ribazoletransferase